MKKIFLFCMGICIILIGCDAQQSDRLPMKDSVINESKDNSRKEERQTEYLETMEDSSETLPFRKISDIGKDSFDYIAPKDEEKLEDVIVIFLTDYNSGTRYECSIPIIFSPTRDTVISN